MKIVVLNYTGYRSNWGSQATSRGLIQWISNVLFKDMPSSIEIVPYPPTHWRDIWHQKFEGEFLKALYANPSPKYDDLIKLERLCVKRFGRQLERVKMLMSSFFRVKVQLADQELTRERNFSVSHLLPSTYIKSASFHVIRLLRFLMIMKN